MHVLSVANLSQGQLRIRNAKNMKSAYVIRNLYVKIVHLIELWIGFFLFSKFSQIHFTVILNRVAIVIL